MTKFREKAEGRTMQVVGQMIGDDKLVQEGKEQAQQAEQEVESASKHDENSEPAAKARAAKASAPRRMASGSSR